MALRLLATFPLFSLKGEQVLEMNVVLWYPQVGLITWAAGWPYSSQAAGTYIVTLDGIVVEPATFYRNPGGFWGPYWGWWPARQRLISMDANGFELFWEPKTLIWGMTPPEDQLTPANDIQARYVKLKDRRIWYEPNKNRILAQYNGPTMHPVVECAGLPFRYGDLHAGRGDEDVWIYSSNDQNRGCFYDTVEKKVASPIFYIDTRPGEVTHTICYVPEFGVFVSGHSVESPSEEVPWRRVIRIWAMEVNPTVLQPIAPVVGTPKAGQIVTYRTRLLGAHNDAAEGELVNWFLDGAGQLLDMQSKTDADGYATTRVQYGLADIGPSTVTARVLC